MGAKTGDRAPRFELPAAPGETVSLAEELGEGPAVLLFFPLAFSRVCTREMCAFRDDWERWEETGARMLAISVDSPFVTSRFREELELPFPVLSDFNRTAAEAYGVLEDDMMGLRGVAQRAAFVVDRDGKVVYRWVADDAGQEPDYEAVNRAVPSR